ncbi:uncharacterized protein L201_004451 [Kwoniella dendrophila CBS 6074]|uniref:DNA/RNA-binding protein Alba-like domain-containing protein n=1 Tax=Kwoniella dendrophila CBS 6074 TaxID=1295534 RepID=A0AAX4JVX5_9TREE
MVSATSNLKGKGKEKEMVNNKNNTTGSRIEPAKPKGFNPNEPYRMRVTSGGSISSYVEFAVRFLHDNPHTPLVLHTLSPTNTSANDNINAEAGPSKSTNNNNKYSTTFLQCTTTIPRLISAVEIIKRTYLSELRSASLLQSNRNRNNKEKNIKIRMSKGIWQYTETNLYNPPAVNEKNGSLIEENSLERVLGGKTKPKMIHHPYLTITLSTKPLDDILNKRNVTEQYILVKKKTRCMKGGKSKLNLDQDEQENAEVEDGMEVDNNKKKLKSIVNAETRKDKSNTTVNNAPEVSTKLNSTGGGTKRSSDNEQDKDRIGKKRKVTSNEAVKKKG